MSEVKKQLPHRFKVKSYNMRTKPGQTQARLYGVAFYPTVLVMDGQGKVHQRIVGTVSAADLHHAIEAVLAR